MEKYTTHLVRVVNTRHFVRGLGTLVFIRMPAKWQSKPLLKFHTTPDRSNWPYLGQRNHGSLYLPRLSFARQVKHLVEVLSTARALWSSSHYCSKYEQHQIERGGRGGSHLVLCAVGVSPCKVCVGGIVNKITSGVSYSSNGRGVS